MPLPLLLAAGTSLAPDRRAVSVLMLDAMGDRLQALRANRLASKTLDVKLRR